MSQIRQNYQVDCEALINKQINMELQASYVYRSMVRLFKKSARHLFLNKTISFACQAAFFDQDDQALHGFSHYFKEQSKEESEHVDKLVKYQNKRGGRVTFHDIAKPVSTKWGSPLAAVQEALSLEKSVNESLLALHKSATGNQDPHLCDFLESHFLEEQVEAIKKLGDLITKMKRAGEGLGVHVIDKELKS